MEVTSCIDGRIRIRDEKLREPFVASSLQKHLHSLPEIRSVRTNPRTGSLLIIYDRIRATLKRILSAVSRFFGLSVPEAAPGAKPQDTPAKAARPYFDRRRVVNLGMLVSLIVSIGGAVAGTEGMHIVVGVLFLALVGIHVSGRLRPLFI